MVAASWKLTPLVQRLATSATAANRDLSLILVPTEFSLVLRILKRSGIRQELRQWESTYLVIFDNA